jgi:hypothetical protein
MFGSDLALVFRAAVVSRVMNFRRYSMLGSDSMFGSDLALVFRAAVVSRVMHICHCSMYGSDPKGRR